MRVEKGVLSSSKSVHIAPESRTFKNEGFERDLDECRESCWTSAFGDDESVYRNHRRIMNNRIISK